MSDQKVPQSGTSSLTSNEGLKTIPAGQFSLASSDDYDAFERDWTLEEESRAKRKWE